MNTDQRPRARIEVEENHIYDVHLSNQTSIIWRQGQGVIRIQIPYEGKKLKDVSTDQPEITLGEVVLAAANATQAPESLVVSLPTGSLLPEYLKGGMQMVWQTNYTVTEPPNTVIAVEGTVYDGASIGEDMKRLGELIRNQIDAFSNNLRLQISFWAPNLITNIEFNPQARELEEMILQQQNDQQIFRAKLESEQLARDLAALANSGGGRILIGVGEKGNITGNKFDCNEVEPALLNALLKIEPALPINQPTYFSNVANNGNVVYLRVPGGLLETYRVNRTIYRRRDCKTVAEESKVQPQQRPSVRDVGNVRDILAQGNTSNIAVIDAKDTSLENLDLGSYICGMLNAHQPQGLIVIRNLSPTAINGRLVPFARRSTLLERLDVYLRSIQQNLSPRIALPCPYLTQMEAEYIALLPIPNTLVPVALYKNQGYCWNGKVLIPLSQSEVFTRYFEHMGTDWAEYHSNGLIRLTHGHLDWPLQPPTTLNQLRQADVAGYSYDVQQQAMVWQQREFATQEPIGWRCVLNIPLRHSLMSVDALNNVITLPPELEGTFHIQLDNILISNTGITFNSNQGPFQILPVFKRTNVVINLKVQAQILFARRRHTMLLCFNQSDVTMDSERVADVYQACVDIGFRVYDNDDWYQDSNSSFMFRGIRSTNYNDISLLALLHWQPLELRRELRYAQRNDIRTVHTGMLSIYILLWGFGENVSAEMARLHLKLHQIISQRLAYLTTE